MIFNNLKNYSDFSIEKGFLKLNEITKLIVKDKQKIICLTENNNISSFPESCLLAKKYNLKTVLGCELYIYDDDENINGYIYILVKNSIGYKNICKLINQSWYNYKTFGFNFIKLSNLKKNNNGLIFYSGGKHSFSKGIFKGNLKKIIKIIDKIKTFKKEILIEIQRFNKNTNIESEKLINISYKSNTPLIATNPNLISESNDISTYKTKFCIKNKKKYIELENNNIKKSQKFLKQKKANKIFKDIPSSIYNTTLVANKCNFFPNLKRKFPSFYYRKKKSKNIFKNIIKKKLEKRENKTLFKKRKYLKTLYKEIKIIKRTNFIDFFLIVYDIVKWAKKNKNIQIGPGRGSSASSLVSFVLGITDINPVKNNLLFERFLNKKSLPDFDIDIPNNKRKLVIKYIKKKYIKSKVTNIVTFGKFSFKVSIKDTGRIMGLRYNQVKNISSLNEINDNKIKRIIKKITGRIRNIGIHAGGIIISKKKNPFPILYIKKNNKKKYIKISQFDKKNVEYLGFLKLDLLGLRTLSVINEIKNKVGCKKNFSNINIKDKKTFEIINKGKTTGVFQLEGYGIKKLLIKTKIKKFNDLIAILALYRPGPMFLIKEFCIRKKNKIKVRYLNNKFKKILKETYGLIIYQEQILKIIFECTKLNINKSEVLRKKIFKNENIEKCKELFLKSVKSKYIEHKNKILDMIINFSGYGFNKAHAVSYAMLTFYMSYLKSRYFKDFMIANLNIFINDKKKINNIYKDCLENNIKFIKPNINKSNFKFKKCKKGILIGFGGIKGSGKKATRYIIKERKKNKYKNFFDFYYRMDKKVVSKKIIESLIFSNVFSLKYKKKNTYLKFVKKNMGKNLKQTRLFDIEKIYRIKKISKNKKIKILEKEYNCLGFFISNPIDLFIKEINKCFYLINSKRNYNFFYYGYIDNIIQIKGKIILKIKKSNKEFKIFYIKNIDEVKNSNILTLFGFYNNYKITIKKIINISKK
ncbi:DNA polymerase III subunit alpha [Candidatus Vidania fulgoroideorum]